MIRNPKKVNITYYFVNQECSLDIQMSFHFVVLLIKHLKYQYLELTVPLHLTKPDSCEVFFSKIGGMVGMECAYEFCELVNCTNTFIHVVVIEYGENGF
jgi:hypothetical protein